MELYLAKPSLEYKEQIMDFRQEFLSNNEIAYVFRSHWILCP